MRRDGLVLAVEEMQPTIQAHSLKVDLERRLLFTPYNGTFVFRNRASIAHCHDIVMMAVRAVESEKEKHRMTADEEIATTLA